MNLHIIKLTLLLALFFMIVSCGRDKSTAKIIEKNDFEKYFNPMKNDPPPLKVGDFVCVKIESGLDQVGNEVLLYEYTFEVPNCPNYSYKTAWTKIEFVPIKEGSWNKVLHNITINNPGKIIMMNIYGVVKKIEVNRPSCENLNAYDTKSLIIYLDDIEVSVN